MIFFHSNIFLSIRFSTEESQKSHTLRIHEKQKEEKKEICEYCAKRFATRQDVLSHVRSMHTESSIRKTRVQCEICDAWLSNRYTLKDHMTRHNSGPQKCPQCDKVSPNQNALGKKFETFLNKSSSIQYILLFPQHAISERYIVIEHSPVTCAIKLLKQQWL